MLLLLSLVMGGQFAQGQGAEAQSPPGRGMGGPPPVSVILSPVVERAIRSQINSIGTVEPQISTTVSSEIEGLVQASPLQEGDRVEKGKTVLVRLKDSIRRIDLDEAKAAHQRAVAQLEKLKTGLRKEEIEEVRAQLKEKDALMDKYKRDLERASELLRSKIINVSEYNRAESDYLAAKYQVQRLEQSLKLAQMGSREEDIAAQEAEVQRQKANLDRVRDELEKTVIRAPISGFITKKYVEVGQWLQRGGPVADIVDIDTVLVRTAIREIDIRHVRVGDPATIIADAYPNLTSEGRVRDIIPQADVASRTFPVKIEVNNPEYRLKGGMFARVALFYGPEKPALMVPKDALSQLGVHAHVFVADKGVARLVPVKTGRTVGGYVEIVEGSLTKDQRVIVTGNESLKDRGRIIVQAIRTPDGKVILVKGGPPGGGGNPPWGDGRGDQNSLRGGEGASRSWGRSRGAINPATGDRSDGGGPIQPGGKPRTNRKTGTSSK